MTDYLPIAKTADELLAPCSECLPLGFVPKGKVFWVDNEDTANGADLPSYGSFDAPFLTLLYAVNQCVSGRRDTVVLKARHDEDYAGGIQIAKASTTVLGLGNPWYGPRINFTGVATNGLVIAANDVSVVNLRIENGAAGIQNHSVKVAGHRALVAGCNMFTGTAANEIDKPIAVIGDFDDIRIVGNKIIAGDAAVTGVSLEPAATQNRILIAGNYMNGQFATAGIHLIAGKTVNNLQLHDNLIYQRSDVPLIYIEGTATGDIANGRGTKFGVAGIPGTIDPDSCACNQNYVNEDKSKSGILEPAA